MKTKIIEATNGFNWGKFMLAQFDGAEWSKKSVIDQNQVIRNRGWTPEHWMVFDLQTGEGALFRHGGLASADLHKHAIWVCPLFEPFLTWFYEQPKPDLATLPDSVTLPDAPSALWGHRRPGPRKTKAKAKT